MSPNPISNAAQSADQLSTEAQSCAGYLQDAFLYALKLNGIERSREALLQSIPLDEQGSFDGLIRAVLAKGACDCCSATLSRIEQVSLPCVLLRREGVECVAMVVEACESEGASYKVREFGAGSSGSAELWLVEKFNDLAASKVVSINASSGSYFADSSSSGALSSGAYEGGESADPSRTSQASIFSKWMTKELKSLASVYRDVLLATVLVNLFALASPLFVMNVYDRVVPNQAIETLWVLASGLILVLFFELVIKLIRHHYLELAGQRLDLVLSSRLFTQVLNIRMDVFPPSVGSLASQLKDFDSIKQFFTAATLTALVDVPFALMLLLVIYVVGGSVVVVPLLAASAMILYGFMVHFPIKKVVAAMQASAAEKSAILVESLNGVETLKSLNAEGRQQGFWESSLIRLSRLTIKAKRLTDSVSIVSATLMQLSIMTIIIVGVYLIEHQALSLGALIACVLLSSRALSPMIQVASLMTQYQQARSALGALDGLTTKPSEYRKEKTYIGLGGKIALLEARDLSFSYNESTRVLKSLSLSLKAGDKVAIIGKIGSGKSSLMRLLMGFGQAESGQLLINGSDLQHLDLSELRSEIGYVPQEIVLFKGTLRDNIVMKSPQISQESIMQALEISGLSDFVQNHPMGLDMPIGESGKGLSGGQRQCVAIARSLINEPSLLLFDELTSSMDNQSEQVILNNIRDYAKDKILLLSTHRASLLALVDRIIVLDEGRVIADGAKNTVLDALKRGLIQPGGQFQASGARPSKVGEE